MADPATRRTPSQRLGVLDEADVRQSVTVMVRVVLDGLHGLLARGTKEPVIFQTPTVPSENFHVCVPRPTLERRILDFESPLLMSTTILPLHSDGLEEGTLSFAVTSKVLPFL